MDITISSSLTPREKDKIFLLLDACYKKEPVSLTFPTEEADHYLLAWEKRPSPVRSRAFRGG